jgi:hypothetical protein
MVRALAVQPWIDVYHVAEPSVFLRGDVHRPVYKLRACAVYGRARTSGCSRLA